MASKPARSASFAASGLWAAMACASTPDRSFEANVSFFVMARSSREARAGVREAFHAFGQVGVGGRVRDSKVSRKLEGAPRHERDARLSEEIHHEIGVGRDHLPLRGALPQEALAAG